MVNFLPVAQHRLYYLLNFYAKIQAKLLSCKLTGYNMVLAGPWASGEIGDLLGAVHS